MSSADTYVLNYLLDDDAAIVALRDAPVSDGFEVTVESNGELSSLVLVDPEWTVSLARYAADGRIALS